MVDIGRYKSLASIQYLAQDGPSRSEAASPTYPRNRIAHGVFDRADLRKAVRIAAGGGAGISA